LESVAPTISRYTLRNDRDICDSAIWNCLPVHLSKLSSFFGLSFPYKLSGLKVVIFPPFFPPHIPIALVTGVCLSPFPWPVPGKRGLLESSTLGAKLE